MMRSVIRRSGMTLVELLVVVAIIGLLAVTVLPSLASSTESRRTKESARVVSSFVATCHAKAIGQPASSGFGLIKTSSGPAAPAVDVVPARIPDPYRGDSSSAVAKLTTSGTLSFTGTGPVIASCTTGDLIRFNGSSAWYGLLAPSGTSWPFSLTIRGTGASTVDALAGQTLMNTPYPVVEAWQPFEILRGPSPSGGVLSIGNGRCIDTFWSSLGLPSRDYLGEDATVAGNGAFFVLFGATGQLRQVVAGPSRFFPDGPILLLIGRVERSGQSWAPLNPGDDGIGANWQYADSIWIAIDPLTGACKSAECDAANANGVPPSGLSMPEQTRWRLLESRRFIQSVLNPPE
jgi:prepilin-type N-terminal cleavage/methylation domain-containing protein